MTTDTLEALREAAVNAATALEVMGLSETVVVNGERDLKAEALTVANRLRLALSRIDAALAEGEGDDGWIKWHGGENPVGQSVVVRKYRDGLIGAPLSTREAGTRWQHTGDDGDIIAYRPTSPDHIGDSTTMVPTLGVEGVAEDDLIEVLNAAYKDHQNGAAAPGDTLFRFMAKRLRAMIAARGKNDG
jgi:hypothetical protein